MRFLFTQSLKENEEDFKIKVSVKDVKQANELVQDMRLSYEKPYTDLFIFDDEEDYEAAIDLFDSYAIEYFDE